MFNKAVYNYSHALRFVPVCCNTQKMCNKCVGTYSAIQLVPECYKLQEIRDKTVDVCTFAFDSVSDWYMTEYRTDIENVWEKLFPNNCVINLLIFFC